MRIFTISFFALSIFIQCPSPRNVDKEIDRLLTQLELESGFSGAVHVSDQGKTVLSKGYGYCDRQRNDNCDTTTLFDIGSLTKQFTAAAVMMLVEDGLMDTGDFIGRYLESVPEDKSTITVHHLLTHSAGFQGAIGDDYEKISKQEFQERAFETQLLATPGEKYEYSNLGYSLLAIIIEKVSGKEFDEFLKEKLFHPSGMMKTGYVLDDTKVALGYRKDLVWGKPNEKDWRPEGPYWNLLGNGGMLSSIEDLSSWYTALTKGEVLSKESRKMIFEAYIDEGSPSSHYGYGWSITRTKSGEKLLSHNGGNGYFFADFLIFSESDQNVILLCNNSASIDERLAWGIAKMYREPGYEFESESEKQGLNSGLDLTEEQENFLADFLKILDANTTDQENFINRHYHPSLKDVADMSRHLSMMERFQVDFASFDFDKASFLESAYLIPGNGESLFIDLENEMIIGIRIED